MRIEHIADLEYENALIAEQIAISDPSVIMEIAAKVFGFTYERAKNDPKPKVLVLGRWQHPNTANKLVVGLNLNYLSDSELRELRDNLPTILEPGTLKERYWAGRRLLPHVWKAFRTYDERYIHQIKATDLGHKPADYEEPQKPGKPTAAKEIGPKAAAAVDKVKEVEAQKTDQPPKEPKKKRSVWRLAGDTLKRLAGAIKSKLFRNRKKAQAKQQAIELQKAEKAKPEPKKKPEIEPEEPELTPDQLAELEKLEQVEQQAKEEPKEPEKPQEGRLANLNMLLEATIDSKPLLWKSPANYIYWHTAEKFAEYQPRLKGCILDYATGTKLVAIHNILEDKTIIDLVDDPTEMLARADWPWEHTIRIIYDGEILIESDSVIVDDIKKRPIWKLFQAVAGRQ